MNEWIKTNLNAFSEFVLSVKFFQDLTENEHFQELLIPRIRI